MLKRLFSGEESHRTSQPGVGMVSQKSKKSRSVRVSTMDAELEFQIDVKTSGKALFDLVCRTIGLRETWYFGLQYIDPKGYVCWMKPGKKVLAHNIPKDDVISLQFLAKFYPEDITLLVQQVTQHLFFLQVRQYILSMDIYCPPAPSVLLASYAMQAKYGDIVDELTPDIWAIEKLLPQRVIDQFEMTADMWVDKVKPYHADHQGMHRDDAELEYLKIVQELEMYGINYFSISNKKNSELWLGIDALGLKVYAKDNRLEPEIMFPWSEIKTILCRDRKFTIKLSTGKRPANDSLLSTTGRVRDFVFTAQKSQTSKLILELCIGNHELFKQRRVPDTMEVQQMKTQASEEKARREAERFRIAKEKQMREQLMKEKEEALQMIAKLKEEYQQSQNALLRSEETADLLAEKSQTTEEEATLLRKKALEAENEVQRIKMAAKKVEEENFKMDRRVQESEHLMAQIVDEYKLRTVEVAQLKDELQKKNEITEQLVKEKLMQQIYQPTMTMSAGDIASQDYRNNDLQNDLQSNIHSDLHLSRDLQTNLHLTHDLELAGELQIRHDLEVGRHDLQVEHGLHSETGLTTADLAADLVNLPLDIDLITLPHQQNMYQSPLNLSPLSTDFIDYDRLTLEQPLEISQGHSGLVTSDIDDVNVEMLPIGEGDAHEIADMALNLENHRAEYMEKSKHLHADLEELKNNIEVFQVDEKQTAEDVIHEEILRKGETKHTTLKKIKSGTTKARVQYFEEL